MSFFNIIKPLVNFVAPSVTARENAKTANKSSELAADVQRERQLQEAEVTRSNAALNSIVSDARSKELYRQQQQAISRIQRNEILEANKDRSDYDRAIQYAFLQGADLTTLSSAGYLRYQLANIQASEGNNPYDAQEAISSVKQSATSQNQQMKAKLNDVNYGTVKGEKMKTGSALEALTMDVGRGVAAYYSNGQSLQYDNMLGFNQKNAQANSLFSQAKNSINSSRSSYLVDSSADFSSVFNTALNTYFAKKEQDKRKELSKEWKQTHVDQDESKFKKRQSK
jgi:hypothetical protein|nr:MAG TPA: hypothetical protein [Caudoviricetes sp.]